MKDKTAFIFTGQGEDLGLPLIQITTFWQSLSLAKILVANGIKPDVVAGLSLGEYTALAMAGALGIDEMESVLKYREELMARVLANSNTGMVACIGLDSDTLKNITMRTNTFVTNFNSPMQAVVGGKLEDLEQFKVTVLRLGAKAVTLPVCGAFHSSYLEKASREFEGYLNKLVFNPLNVPIYLNINGEPTDTMTSGILAEQMCSPVRFVQIITKMIQDGVNQFYSIGIGTAPVGLIRDISMSVGAKVKIRKIENIDDIRKAIK